MSCPYRHNQQGIKSTQSLISVLGYHNFFLFGKLIRYSFLSNMFDKCVDSLIGTLYNNTMKQLRNTMKCFINTYLKDALFNDMGQQINSSLNNYSHPNSFISLASEGPALKIRLNMKNYVNGSVYYFSLHLRQKYCLYTLPIMRIVFFIMIY